MSYEIIKGIKIKKELGEIWVKSDSNNVSPKDFQWWHSKILSKILVEKGIEEAQKEILLQFYLGNFQKSNSLYEKSLILLDNSKYNWNIEVPNDELKKVLFENFNLFKKRVIGKFIVKNTVKDLYVQKFTKFGCSLNDKRVAKVFKSKEEAQLAINGFHKNYTIEEL